MTENEKPRVVWPTANLPTTAAKWVRTVQKLLTDLSEQVDRIRLNTDRALKTLSLDLGKSTRTVNTLVDVVNALPITNVYENRVAGFDITTSITQINSVDISWIEGKTKCDVFAVASSNTAPAPTGSSVTLNIGIDNTNGMSAYNWTSPNNRVGNSVAFSYSSTKGSDFTVTATIYGISSQPTNATNNCSLSVIAVFS